MKKVFLIAGSLFLLFRCTKDKRIERSEEGISIAASSGTGRHVIQILNSGYSPDSLRVDINDTVSWVNADNKVHTVTFDKFGSGDIQPGSTFTHVFGNAGHDVYRCNYHSEKGILVVTAIR
jgi:plastocyanin